MTLPQWSRLSPNSRLMYAVLGAYALGFLVFWPRVLMVVDEERYVSQALAFARGAVAIPGAGILFPAPGVSTISNFPPGTSLLQTPFVWALGWRGAALLSVIALAVCTLVTARWLRDCGRNPGFALLIPAFLPVALFGRVAMSDVPSAALVAIACWALWRAQGSTGLSLLAGFCVGVSVLFRETLFVLLAPLLAGALLRRSGVTWALACGFLAGGLTRLGVSELLFDAAAFVRDPGYGFSLSSLRHTLPVYAVVLLVMFPGAALLPVFYRGSRRAELVTGASLYVATFLLYGYDGIRLNGPAKGLVLMSRFMVPLVPVLAFMAADVWPRVWRRMRAGSADDRTVVLLTRAGAMAAIALALGVHLMAWRQEADAALIVRDLARHTSAEVPVITNSNATLKYLSPAYGSRQLVLRYGLNADTIAAIAGRFGTLSLALMDRFDSEIFRGESADNERFVAMVRDRCALTPTHQSAIGTWAQLRIFEVSGCR